MKEKEKEGYHTPTLTEFGKVSQITASGGISPPELAPRTLKDREGPEEFKEGA